MMRVGEEVAIAKGLVSGPEEETKSKVEGSLGKVIETTIVVERVKVAPMGL